MKKKSSKIPKIRKTWGTLNPQTRVVPSKKNYNRQKFKKNSENN